MRSVRFLFRGLRRQTGEPVEGRIFALGEDVARHVLGEQGIAVMSIAPESATRAAGTGTGCAPLFDPSLQDVLEEARLRIRFDQLAHRYEGGNVWILDRHRIPGRVMQLANEAIGRDDSRRALLRRIEQVLEALFGQPRPAPAERSADSPGLIGEVGRLAAALDKIEKAIASMSLAPRNEPRHVMAGLAARSRKNKEMLDVLIEIFEDNLELRRGIGGPAILPESRLASAQALP